MTGEDVLLDELRALYRDVDALFATSSCPASTECCRFGRTRREPYVTGVELALVRRAIARSGGGLPRSPAPLLPLVADERACPLLTPEGRCSIYAERPFGCRTFFCERADNGVKHRDVLALVARLKGLAGRHEPNGDEGRPLTRVLSLKKSSSRPSKPRR